MEPSAEISLQEFGKTFPVETSEEMRLFSSREGSSKERRTWKSIFYLVKLLTFQPGGTKSASVAGKNRLQWDGGAVKKVQDGNGLDRRRHQAWQCAEMGEGRKKKPERKIRRAH